MILDRENKQVLNLVQALLGAITPNYRAVFINVTEGDISIKFVLEKDSSEDKEEIRDIVFEFEALQEKSLKVGCEVLISTSVLENMYAGRAVYMRKEA